MIFALIFLYAVNSYSWQIWLTIHEQHQFAKWGKYKQWQYVLWWWCGVGLLIRCTTSLIQRVNFKRKEIYNLYYFLWELKWKLFPSFNRQTLRKNVEYAWQWGNVRPWQTVVAFTWYNKVDIEMKHIRMVLSSCPLFFSKDVGQ